MRGGLGEGLAGAVDAAVDRALDGAGDLAQAHHEAGAHGAAGLADGLLDVVAHGEPVYEGVVGGGDLGVVLEVGEGIVDTAHAAIVARQLRACAAGIGNRA